MKVFFFCNSPSYWEKKKPSLTPTCFPSFFSSHTQLLTPAPFLSALFKSKQKTHLVCLLAPSLSYFLSVEHSPSFFSLKFFSAASIRVEDNILLVLRAGRESLAVIHNFMDTNSTMTKHDQILYLAVGMCLKTHFTSHLSSFE